MSSYPKGHHNTSERRRKPRKRIFHGNQFTNKDTSEAEGPSTSAKKLRTDRSENVTANPSHCYRIIEFFTVFTALSDILICQSCKQNITFEETGMRGLGFKIVINCQCGRREISSGPYIGTGFEINRRIVFVMRLLGIGRQGLNTFCNYMDIGSGLTEGNYNKNYNHIHVALKKVFEFCCKKAVEEEKTENEQRERPPLDVKVSGDGSWKKCGIKSFFGVITLIGYYSGKVVDMMIKSSYCQACMYWKSKPQNTVEYEEWKEEHDEESCAQDHHDSTGSVEVESIKEMFSRSEELYGVRYGNNIGDGDSEAFNAILKVKPYGDEFSVRRSQCICPIQKRMGFCVRNIRKKDKLIGEEKLTEALLNKLCAYYGLAFSRSVNRVEDMKKAIIATFHHLQSTDENPRHENCPEGVDSWCYWQQAKALRKEPEPRPAPLHPDVQNHILPVYEDLSREDLLQRCLGGHTQNANESFNSTVWRLAPNNFQFGYKIIEVAAFLAAILFNEGHSGLLMVMNELQLVVGRQSYGHAEQMDQMRVTRQNRQNVLVKKEARKAHKEEMQTSNELREEEDGLMYGAGTAD